MTVRRGIGWLLAGVLCVGCGGREPGTAAGHAPARVSAPVREQIAPAAPRVSGTAVASELVFKPWVMPEVAFDPEQWSQARRKVRQAIAANHLYEDADAAVPWLLAMQQARPEDRQVSRQLEQVSERLRQQFERLLREPERQRAALAQAGLRLQVLQHLPVEASAMAQMEQALEQARERLALNRRGEASLRRGQLGISGPGALADFQTVLERWPGDARALQGVAAVESALLRRAEEQAAAGNFSQAEKLLSTAAPLREPVGTVEQARERVEQLRNLRVESLLRSGLEDIQSAAGLRAANEKLQLATQVAHAGDARVRQLAWRIELATRYGLYAPGQALRDRLSSGGFAPQMVVVPHGQYLMGAGESEPGAVEAEQPAHWVRLERGFAIAATEVTVAQFGRFVAAAGARPRATRRGHSMVYEPRTGNFIRRSGVDWRSDYLGAPAHPDAPVMHVSVRDAEAYAAWLSEQTGHYYRLPSEAEFEYALRAGRQGRYPWGDAASPPANSGNFTGDGDLSPSGRRWSNAFVGYADGWWGAATVGSFAPNPFGLYDMEGNLSEWVADCWHASYRRAPADGVAWFNPGCRRRVVRGANWANSPLQTRAAWRWLQESDVTNARIGFRVVRGL